MPQPPPEVIVQQLRRAVPGGIGTYIHGLLQGLRENQATVTLVATRGDPLSEDFPLRPTALPGPLLTRCWDWGMPVGVSATGVIHGTSLATPYPRRARVVVMVHDLAWREVPDAFPRRGRRWHEAALQRCIRRAKVIIAPSTRTAQLLEAAGAKRVEVIAEGCDHLPPADQSGATELLQGLGVTTPYLLSVSTVEPRKNLGRLLQAYDRARPDLPEPWPLVVVGPKGWGSVGLPATAGVKLAGAVPAGVLAALYAGARCLAYVPLVEGWGLPAVEAMAACTPVVASPMPSTGGAALEVDPRREQSIAEGLVTAAGNEQARSSLVTAGLLRAGELTWDAAARQHLKVWENV
jgi:glycosyltransferase involved in cell wall biosynthesis